MLCDVCKKRPASIHMKKVVNGQTWEQKLCQQCAAGKGEYNAIMVEHPFSVHDLLSGLFNFVPVRKDIGPEIGPACPNCHMTFGDISRIGRLGCSVCYDHFNELLEPLVRRLQGSSEHTGKSPLRQGGKLRMKNELRSLKEELRRHIAHEEYEKAAEVRDRIKQIEQEINKAG